MKQPKQSVRSKVEKQMPEFADEVAGLSVEQLNSRLAELAKASEAVRQAKEADEGLEEAQANVSLLAAPYREAKSAIGLKTTFIVGLIQEKGGDV